MISLKTVSNLIDQVELKYSRCFDILAGFRDSSVSLLDTDLLEFQPVLASALFEIDVLYRQIRQEEKKVISRKSQLSPKWFRQRLKNIKEFREMLKGTIKIGKALGDSFVWAFYSNDGHH